MPDRGEMIGQSLRDKPAQRVIAIEARMSYKLCKNCKSRNALGATKCRRCGKSYKGLFRLPSIAGTKIHIHKFPESITKSFEKADKKMKGW